MSDNPYSIPASDISSSTGIPQSQGDWQYVVGPLQDVAGWTRFLGIVLIIIGVLYCITIFGAIIGWLPIWLGILLLKSGDNVKTGIAGATQLGISQLSKAIKIAGVAACVFLCFMALYIVFVIIAIAVGLSTAAVPPAGP